MKLKIYLRKCGCLSKQIIQIIFRLANTLFLQTELDVSDCRVSSFENGERPYLYSVFFLFEQPGKEHQTTPQFFRRGVDKTEDIFSIFTMFSINVSSVYT